METINKITFKKSGSNIWYLYLNNKEKIDTRLIYHNVNNMYYLIFKDAIVNSDFTLNKGINTLKNILFLSSLSEAKRTLADFYAKEISNVP